MKNFLLLIAGLDTTKVFTAAAVIGGIYYLMLFDSGQALKAETTSLRAQVNTEQAKKNDTELTLQEEKRMKEAIGILSEQYQIISKKIPTQLSTFEINSAVEAYARETQVRILSAKPSVPEKMEIVEEVPLEVSLVGKYADLLQFIYSVSTAERLTRLKNFNLGPSGPEDRASSPNALKLEGIIVGYRLATETSAPPASTPAANKAAPAKPTNKPEGAK